MLKVIVNSGRALCLDCGCVGTKKDKAVCAQCNSSSLVDSQAKQVFLPMFEPANFYQASKYTPLMPDRREKPRDRTL